jgi:CDP-glycerol glycerophosphotransferase (TagB/SpsB family)
MHFSMFETLYGSLGHDERIERHFTSSWPAGLKAPIDSLCRMVGASGSDFVPYGKAKWQKWDLYVSSCFDNPWLARSVPWVDTFHGVGEKWVADGSRLYMCHPLAARYDRLLCPNRRLAQQFEAHPAFLKTSESLKLTGLAKSDVLTWYNVPEVRVALKKALGLPVDRAVVLFAPTWGPDGLLARYGEQVIDVCLRVGGSLVVKLHSCSYQPETAFGGGGDWRKRMDDMARERGFLHLPDASLTSLMLAADVMISDFGSAPVEYCLLDRPLLFFAIPAQAAATGGDRYQFNALRKAGCNVTTLDELQMALKGAISGADPSAPHRASLARTFFHNAGNATVNGLCEMYELMNVSPPNHIVEQYKSQKKNRILADPRCFLGVSE